ncbi:MAG: phospho-sugar mutase, partial [Clostridia bacterium]|nr:phospho-sugar mutase [Clostridia bacterium]
MANYIEDYKYWLEKVSAEERQELESVKDNDEQLKRRFAMPLEFGTAGMRGIISLGTGCLNKYTVRRATQGVADFIKEMGKQERGVVISYDTRNFSYEFALETAGVLAYNGIKVYLYNDTHPVPMCSFAIRHLNAFAGIMITASHNPKEYNGYKVYGEDGAQMSPEDTAIVVKYIENIKDYFAVKSVEIKAARDTIKSMNDEILQENITVIGSEVDEAYFAELTKLSLSPEAVKEVASKIKIVYTPIHGSGYKPVTTILKKMNIPCNVVEEQKQPDGNFPTVAVPNPEQPDALKMGINLAKQLRSNIVIGTDPDADRMGVAIKDNNGEFVLLTGNQIGAMMMNYILMRHKDMGT